MVAFMGELWLTQKSESRFEGLISFPFCQAQSPERQKNGEVVQARCHVHVGPASGGLDQHLCSFTCSLLVEDSGRPFTQVTSM